MKKELSISELRGRREVLEGIPTKTREAFGKAQESAFLIMGEAWSVFEGHVADSIIGETIKEKDNFQEGDVKYAHTDKEEIYSVAVFLKSRPRILTLKIGEGSLEMLLTDKRGKEIEYLTHEGSMIEKR